MTKDSTVGATFLFLSGGLVVGIVISGLRAAFLDPLIVRDKPKFNFESLKDKDTQTAYKEAITNTYRFYQFYGNMLLALGLYVAVKYFPGGIDIRKDVPMLSLEAVVLVGLGVQSRKSLMSTYNVIGKLLGTEKAGPKISTKKLPDGKVGQLYKCALESKDGIAPIKWMSTGSLPGGLALDPCGGLSGTPSTEGEAKIDLRIDDAAQGSDSKQFSLRINK